MNRTTSPLRTLTLMALLLTTGLLGCGRKDDPQSALDIPNVPGVEGLYIVEGYTTGVGGFLTVVYRPYLLFKNGDVYRNLYTNPDKLNIAESKTREPKEWGKWTRQGDDFTVTWSATDTDKWEKGDWFLTVPAANNEQFSGSFKSISGGGNVATGGTVLIFSVQNLSFSGDKFTYERTGGGSSDQVTAYSSQTKAGTYHLNGHVLTLRFNNGSVEKPFFYFYPDKTVFGVGSAAYVPS